MPFLTIIGGRIEYESFVPEGAAGPDIVMLHEGLGSVAMWKDFPARLAGTTGSRVIAYSRHGHGRSEVPARPRNARYMHDEALIVLPRVLDALNVERPVLFGHSDGASIALIYAGDAGRPLAGVVALAPHVLVEELSVNSIAATGEAWHTTDLGKRLARYHDDADSLFRAWNDIWLSDEFRSWNIEDSVRRISCPILAIQGEEDEYGTMDQVERIARAAPDVELVKLEDCRHSPHRDQPGAVLEAAARWLGRLRRGDASTRARAGNARP
jgi:pimeloyl-ACP methyl ester carboxylesterase